MAELSRPNKALSRTLVAALTLVDVRVLDLLTVSGGTVLSMANRGLL
ncbi:JAB domain-containing protein [Variovorax guangxiensis]|uniref:DNA repair protein RadC n=1 Tax=Variovorax guangxiensis TaxID=1775474 RepID=A0A840FUL3_9BURK|nr:JAB domain-containing protein [Variovorax guangxiensis]MBB4225873.1 DNA repair protein RadC [Variovorax guangxiensis]